MPLTFVQLILNERNLKKKNMVFYWWTPDPTFLDLAPLTLVFPPNDPLRFRIGDYSSQVAGIDIRTIVSRDLARLAPKVELFLSSMRLDLATVNALLLENKNLGERMNETVCRWIQANEAQWESWIPDDTKCFPGFGLFDDVSGNYVPDRDLREGKRQGLQNVLPCTPPRTTLQVYAHVMDSQCELIVARQTSNTCSTIPMDLS